MPFPETEAWLDRLPAGLDSYPTYQQKASILRQFLEDTELPPTFVSELPPALAELVRDPPPANTWVPEVKVNALFSMAAEALFPRPSDQRAHWLTINEHLLSGRLYQALMRVASPALVLKGTDVRWSALHRGMTLKVTGSGTDAEAVLSHPDHFLPERVAQDYAVAFEAILLGADAEGVTSRLVSFEARESRYEVRWR